MRWMMRFAQFDSETSPTVVQPTPDIAPTPAPTPPVTTEPGVISEPSEAIQQYETSFGVWAKGRDNYRRILGYFINILGVDPQSPEGQQLAAGGYKYNQSRNQFGKMFKTEQEIAQIKEELDAIAQACNCSFSDTWIEEARAEAFPEAKDEVIEVDEHTEEKVEAILDSGKIDAMRKKELTDGFVRAKIAELGELTDKQAKNEFIMRFLAITPEFHDYSFLNKILMMLQNDKVSPFVAGAMQWQNPNGKFKRQVREGEKPLQIFAPENNMVYKGLVKAVIPKLQQALSQGMTRTNDPHGLAAQVASNAYAQDFVRYSLAINRNDLARTIRYMEDQLRKFDRYKAIHYGTKKVNGQVMFKLINVYDISQTDPVGPDSFQEPEKGFWQSEHNQNDPMIFALVQAAVDWSKSAKYQMGDEWKQGIDIDLQYEAGREGGWSQGAKIAVDRMSAGLRQLATVVHEIAHSLLHFGPDRAKMTGKQKEIEAESTVFVVLNFFGFTELDFAGNYLALHKASSLDVLDRYNAIDIASQKIIKGIQRHLGGTTEAKLSVNWLKRAVYNSL
jgi:hypothetical protein